MPRYKYKIGASTHYPVLIKLAQITSGPILELGTGLYSTTLLHYLCLPTQRTLVSYDHSDDWALSAQQFTTSFHTVRQITSFDEADIERSWDIAFVDHRPAERRRVDIARLAHYARYVVIHDTEPASERFYRYNRVFPQYKYRYDFTALSPHTTVLSNFVDLSSFSV